MTIALRRKRAKRRNDFVLLPVFVERAILGTGAHHKLQIVDDHVMYVVHILRVLNSLPGCEPKKKKKKPGLKKNCECDRRFNVTMLTSITVFKGCCP